MIKLAIVIPYYKINFFEETLESLAAQTDQRFKVYIGDDASPNAPNELLEKYQGKFNYTYKRFNDNLGSISLVKQWERCIALMQEEDWFMILGDDDVLTENIVQDFLKNLSEIEKTSNVTRFSTVLINEKTEIISTEYKHPRLENAIESYHKKLKGETRSSLSEYIFRKKSYNKFGFKNYHLAWSTDDRAVIDFADEKPVFSINNSNVYVRLSKINISGKTDNYDLKIKASYQSIKDLLKDYGAKMNKEQKSNFFSLFEHHYYKSNNNKFFDTLFLLYLTYENRNFDNFINQIKSTFVHKFIKK